ncbi:MAG: inosine/xanthosine triphosphatase [Halorubrum sp.]
MRIGVGSENPVKRRAVDRALTAVDGDWPVNGPGGGHETALSDDSGRSGRADRLANATIDALAVDSGVSEQPTGHAETVRGAENRVDAVLATPSDDATQSYDLAVGIEGGVARFDGLAEWFLVMWAAVGDGDRLTHGAGPSLRLPAEIAARVDAGEELGPVMDDVLDTTGVARRGGAAGALTAGGVDRTDALTAAVVGALGPFVSDLYE